MRLYITGLLALMLSSGCLISQHAEAALGDDLIQAAKSGTKVISKFFRSDENAEDLLNAARLGDRARVAKLLQRGANVNHANKYGDTALIGASRMGHTEIVSMLLNHGADVNHANMRGYTALTSAVRYGHTEIVSMLLNHGADINYANNSGETALTLAARNCRTEIVAKLLKHGANVNHTKMRGYTALTLATSESNREIVEKLKPHVRKHTAHVLRKHTEELCRKLEDKRFPNEMHVEIMKHLLDVSSRDKVDVLSRKWMHRLTADKMMLLYLFKEDARPVIKNLKDKKPNAMQLDFIGLPAQLQEAIIKKYDAALYNRLIKRQQAIAT